MRARQRPDFLPFGRPSFGPDEIAAVTKVMQAGWVGMGQETVTFEQELRDVIGARDVITVSSCTSALFLSLMALGVGPGDEVICPSLTWCSTANAATYLGARVVFCDVDAASFCVTPDTVLPLVTSRTKALMVVHMGGLAADVDALRAALPSHVAIVEDAAHALGARYGDGAAVGSRGNFTCFSFYANKNLSTGEGGAIALDNHDAAERIRSLRQHGLSTDAWKRYTHPHSVLSLKIDEIGFKMNYTDLQASIGRVQLRRQSAFAAQRLRIAEHYVARLSTSAAPLGFQRQALDRDHARHLMLITLPVEHMASTRDDIVLSLRRRNVGASIHYPPLHHMPVYADGIRTPLPTTDWLADRILTLPISASMSISDAAYVCDHVLDLLGTSTARLAS